MIQTRVSSNSTNLMAFPFMNASKGSQSVTPRQPEALIQFNFEKGFLKDLKFVETSISKVLLSKIDERGERSIPCFGEGLMRRKDLLQSERLLRSLRFRYNWISNSISTGRLSRLYICKSTDLVPPGNLPPQIADLRHEISWQQWSSSLVLLILIYYIQATTGH